MEVTIKNWPEYDGSLQEHKKATTNFNQENQDSIQSLQQSSNSGAFLLHQAEPSQEQEDWHVKLKTLIKDPLLNKVLPDVSNMLNVFGNACAFIAHKFDLPDTVKRFSDLIGVFGTKLFLFVNGTINALEHLSRRNYLSVLGYSLDNLIAAFIPQEHTFLARGLSSGTYHLSYALGLANGKKAKFNDWADHNNHLKEALAKSFDNIFSKDIMSNFFKSSNAISGILGGLFSIGGVLTWPFAGKKVATVLRDIGGSLKSTNYINPGHIFEGRRLYFLSGIFQCVAALADFSASMFKQTRPYMVPASLLTDGLAKYILRQSSNKGELGDVD